MLTNNQQTSNTAVDIIKPIVFLDIFSYPVTPYELWRFLDKKYDLGLVINLADDLVKKKILDFKHGFYFLNGQDDLINIRRARYNYTQHKLKIAKRFGRLFSLFPSVRLVAAANLIGGYNLRLNSDIDLFIVTKPRHIWLTRLFCAGLAQILHSRPTKNYKKNKICLSFYVTTQAINLKNLELDGSDPYFYYWKLGLIPLFDRQNTWLKFLEKNNLASYNKNRLDIFKDVHGDYEIKDKKAITFFYFLEKIAKKFQLKIMSKELKQAESENKGVLISDDVLKLYLKDRRLDFLDKFNLKIHEISQKIN